MFARVLANPAGSANLIPDTIIVHPAQWSARVCCATAPGHGRPVLRWRALLGRLLQRRGQDAGLFGASLWNTRVIVSSVVGAGTALVGNFTSAAQIYRRGGPTVEAANQHASYFQNNLVMIRCEQREALCLYRPSAFTEVRGLA